MDGYSNSDDSYEDDEDYLQKEVELTDPIPGVRRQANILIVGDPQTGKSMLARSFTRFPRTAAKRYHRIAINTKNSRGRKTKKASIGLHFFCAPFRSGDVDCFLTNPLEHQPYSLIIYLFDVNRRGTFRNILYKWHTEVTNYLGEKRMPPCLLVGNKIDLRFSELEQENSSYETVWTEEGEMSFLIIEAQQYIEVCALAEINTRNLLVTILRILNIHWVPDF